MTAYLCLGTTAVLLWFPEPLSLPGGMSLVTPLMTFGLFFAVRGVRSRTYRLLDVTAMRFATIALMCGAFVLLWSNLSIVSAPEPLRSGRVIVTHFSGAALLLLLYATFTVERARTLIGLTLVLAAFVSLLSLMAYFNNTLFAILFADRDRSNGFFKHSNQYGIVLSTVAPVGLALALSARKRLVWLALMGSTAFGFIAAGSKTNLLIFSASSSFLLLCAPLLERNTTMRVISFLRNLGLGVGVATLGVVGLTTFNPRAVRILGQFFSDDDDVKSLLSRKELWDFSLDQFFNHPFFGQGTGQMIPIDYGDGFISHSHNVIVDYMRMLGVPGLAVCLVLLLAAIFALCATIHLAYVARGARYDHRLMTMGLALGGLAYIGANMSSDSFGPSTSPFFWLVTYLALFMRTVLIREHAAQAARKTDLHFGSIQFGLPARKGLP
ncbi:O-antigen ligase family protein [Microvirga sp. G4-2]|uniref:O-antigen ligase family protein n=1 Tax=Microvirga sp. G4-2 TaxID=3434467 RepID=UPI00404397C5